MARKQQRKGRKTRGGGTKRPAESQRMEDREEDTPRSAS